MAGGGRLKELSVADVGDGSLPWISVEAAGVGGARGMIGRRLCINNQQSKGSIACHVPKMRRKSMSWYRCFALRR